MCVYIYIYIYIILVFYTNNNFINSFVQEVEESNTDGAEEKYRAWVDANPIAHSLDSVMEAILLYVHCTVHGVPYTLDKSADLQALETLGCLPTSATVSSVHHRNGGDVEHDDSKTADDGSRLTLGCRCGGSLHNLQAVKLLYENLFHIFSNSLLTTHSLEHTQFIMFYFLSIRPSLVRHYLEELTKVFTCFSSALDVRKNALAYIGSLLARGKFVSFFLVQSCLEVIGNWCQNYVKKQELEQTNNYKSISLHQIFYCACQIIFYVFSFRSREFTCSQKALQFARNLNLEHLVFSRLNPLSACTASIVDNFAAINRHYQLVYCYGIIENNKRYALQQATKIIDTSVSGTVLDLPFPFDPYLLKTSCVYIQPHYQEFPGFHEDICMDVASSSSSGSPSNGLDKKSDNTEEEEDDFLDQSGSNLASQSQVLNLLQFSPDISRLHMKLKLRP